MYFIKYFLSDITKAINWLLILIFDITTEQSFKCVELTDAII